MIFSPSKPTEMDWESLYPSPQCSDRKVEIVDIGCGFGGLLFALAPRFPQTLMLGTSLSV
jgi:tRNA (guanine-N7-)-methyltransferase